MNFERGKNPKEAIGIGLLQACRDLVKYHSVVILDEEETRDMLLFNDKEIWNFYPHPNTAADFMRTNAITLEAGHTICIGTMNNRFLVLKNLIKSGPLVKGTMGTLAELLETLEKLVDHSNPKDMVPFP